MWDGAFSPIGPNGRPKKVSTDPKHPDVVVVPPVPLPAEWDLEVWRGDPKFVHQAWKYDGTIYLTVHFNHTNVCYDGEDVPSNNTLYVYMYDENAHEDAVSGEYSADQIQEIFG